MHLSIQHSTIYQYSEPLIYSIQQLKLTPRDGFGQAIKSWALQVNANMSQYADSHGNVVHTAVMDSQHQTINIIAKGEVETGLKFSGVDETLPLTIFLRETDLTKIDTNLAQFAQPFSALKSIADLEVLSAAIIAKVPYIKGQTAVYTTAAQAFASGAGVCQDHAHIFIACCRSLGVPARYVSGYLFTDDGHLLDSHAWADAWLDNIGWVSVDVSNLCLADTRYVRLATGLDYHEAAPVKGLRVGGGLETLQVGVKIWQSSLTVTSLNMSGAVHSQSQQTQQ